MSETQDEGAMRTLERILREPDDASGQTIRQWCIEREGAFLTLKNRRDKAGFLLIRVSDLTQFVADLYEVANLKAIPIDLKERP